MALQVGRSRIPEWLKKTNRKQVDLARHLGVSQAYISLVCSNQEKLSVENMKMTADYFGCSMEDLVEWIVVPRQDKRQ